MFWHLALSLIIEQNFLKFPQKIKKYARNFHSAAQIEKRRKIGFTICIHPN